MRKPICFMLVVWILTGVSGITFAQDAPAEKGAFDKSNFSATLALTSDYVFRGISYTDGDPAVQGSFDYAHPNGIYLGIWATNWKDWDPNGSDIETDFYVGYSGDLDPFNYDFSAYYYHYPGANDDDAEYDYVEFIVKLKYQLAVALSPAIGIGYAYSPEYSGEDGASNYVNGTLDLTLPLNLTLGFEIGYQDIEGDKSTGNGWGLNGGNGYDYTHWRIGLSTELKGFGLDVSYHNTDERVWLSDNIGPADERVVLTVSRSF